MQTSTRVRPTPRRRWSALASVALIGLCAAATHAIAADAVPQVRVIQLSTPMSLAERVGATAGMRAAIDADTGRLRPAEHDDDARLASPAAALRRAPAEARRGALATSAAPRALSHATGAIGRTLDASRLSYEVVRRGADERAVDAACVVGDAQARTALTAQEDRHDR